MTQRELARLIDVDEGHFSRLLNNEAKASPEMAEKILKAVAKVKVFKNQITELHILYPERYASFLREWK